MKVVGFSGFSGAGKTTLLEQVVARLSAANQRVSVIKRAHHDFDVDQPGKDSWRHRKAGAQEVLVASDRRLARMTELEAPVEPDWQRLVGQLTATDWALLEGFKHARLPKIEVWRPATGKPLLYPDDADVVAIATEPDAVLAGAERLVRLDINDPDGVVAYLTREAGHFERAAWPAMAAPTANLTPTLVPLDDALARMLAEVVPFDAGGVERLSTSSALGRVLAKDVVSTVDVPPADNSAMDGYALRAADVVAAGTVLQVSLRLPAGAAPAMLPAGTAARIFTGAQIPAGADAVVMQENCTAGADGTVAVNAVPAAGLAVRRRGEDVAVGETLLRSGQRLNPQALGLAASVGRATLVVSRRPRVALFSTGDELIEPGEPLPPGAIYNSNRTTLRALIEALGCEPVDFGIVPDQLDATRAALRAAARDHDCIVTSGGVSVGEEDHLKPAVQAEGRLHLWQVAIKPGKPLAFGAVGRADGTAAHFIGLPGNPVASLVTFLIVVRPLLLRLQGASAWQPRPLAARADFDWPRPDKRREFLRVQVNDDGGLALYANQGSGVLTSTVWADGVVDVPPGQVIRRGDTVRYLAFAHLWA